MIRTLRCNKDFRGIIAIGLRGSGNSSNYDAALAKWPSVIPRRFGKIERAKRYQSAGRDKVA
jgi:hypothetical protein